MKAAVCNAFWLYDPLVESVKYREGEYSEEIDIFEVFGKANKKEISKDEAEKILKEAHNHDHNHDQDDKKKETKKTAKSNPTKEKKPSTKASKTKPVTKKVSKK